MARPIDAYVLNNDLVSWYNDTEDEKEKSILRRVMQRVFQAPTLTPPNEPLTVLVLDEPDREYIDYICPKCKEIISQRRRGQHMSTVYQCKYHDRCGQRVDWANPEPYRRLPEGEEHCYG